MTRAEIAIEWRATVVSAMSWRPAGRQPLVDEGDLQGFAVVAQGFRGRGFLKPGVRVPGADRRHFAAREKIAADLAFELGLPVPPAVLWRRDGAPEPNVVITLFVYPQDVKWFVVEFGGVRPLALSEEAVKEALRSVGGMLAFDTWLDQHEHAPHRPGNIVWGFDPASGESGITFLDYASALGSDGSWSAGAGPVVEPAWPVLLRRHVDARQIAAVLAAIERLSRDQIAEIVQRIPEDFLPAPEKNMLEDELVRRQPLVREALANLAGQQP